MEVVILCGGEGVRFKSTREDMPKVLARIGNRPILWHIMRYYRSFGHKKFMLCLGAHQESIREYFAGNTDDWQVELVDTGETTPTGGRIKRVEQYVKGDDFFATYGDGLSDVDLDALLAFHRSHGRAATLTAIRPFNQFGLMDMEEEGRVNRFEEKPRMTQYANGGFFVFNRKIFDYLEPDKPLETSLFTRLVSEGQLMAFKHEGFWKSMDTFKENMELNELWHSGRAAWKRW